MYVYSFYKFQNISRLLSVKKDLLNSLKNLKVMGTILLSPEGINVNMSQSEKNLDKAVKIICNMLNIDGFHINKSVSDFIAFKKLKVKIKDEIIRFNSPTDTSITMGCRAFHKKNGITSCLRKYN